MYIRIDKRADGGGPITLDAETVAIDVPVGAEENTTITVEFDPNSGENGEHRVLVDDECVWSALSPE